MVAHYFLVLHYDFHSPSYLMLVTAPEIGDYARVPNHSSIFRFDVIT
jgi:hypothetical protein